MDLLFITSNKAKINLARERLKRYNINVKQKKFEFREIQSLEVDKVALDKANQLINSLKAPFLIEDSGFYVKSLNGFPGTYAKHVFDLLGDKRFLKLLDNKDSRKVVSKSSLVYCNPKTKEIKLFSGFYEGTLAKKPRGSNKRGWMVTRIFIPKGSNKTLAEINNKEWAEFSDKFRRNDHYEQFGKWRESNLLVKSWKM